MKRSTSRRIGYAFLFFGIFVLLFSLTAFQTISPAARFYRVLIIGAIGYSISCIAFFGFILKGKTKSPAVDVNMHDRPKARAGAQFASMTHKRGMILGVGVSLTGIGVVLLCWFGWLLIRQLSSNTWPYTHGEVVSVTYHTVGRKFSWMSVCNVVYRYTVSGRIYESTKYSLWRHDYREQVASAASATGPYKTEQDVRVYYDPSNPNDAILLRGPNWFLSGPELLLAFGIISLGFQLIWKAKHAPNTALEATADKASGLPKSDRSAKSQTGGASAFDR